MQLFPPPPPPFSPPQPARSHVTQRCSGAAERTKPNFAQALHRRERRRRGRSSGREKSPGTLGQGTWSLGKAERRELRTLREGKVQLEESVRSAEDGAPRGVLQLPSPTTAMNIFRILGDVSHLLAIIILLVKIHRSKSCAGECSLGEEGTLLLSSSEASGSTSFLPYAASQFLLQLLSHPFLVRPGVFFFSKPITGLCCGLQHSTAWWIASSPGGRRMCWKDVMWHSTQPRGRCLCDSEAEGRRVIRQKVNTRRFGGTKSNDLW